VTSAAFLGGTSKSVEQQLDIFTIETPEEGSTDHDRSTEDVFGPQLILFEPE